MVILTLTRNGQIGQHYTPH